MNFSYGRKHGRMNFSYGHGLLWGEHYQYHVLMTSLRQCLRAAGSTRVSDYSSHSFRRGAATALDRAGTSPTTIKELGRWKSEAYQNYLEFSWSQAAAGAAALYAYLKRKGLA